MIKIPKVSVVIPTRNRSRLLKRSIGFVLAQTYKDFELIIVDNASTDDTKKIVSSFKDPRVFYKRNPKNLGIIGNWNKAIEYSRGKYLNIFHDDDVMYPTFLEESVKALDKISSIGFTFSLIKRVDKKRKFLNMWWEDYNGMKGLIKGNDYILLTIEKERCISLAPDMVFRKEAFNKVGLFKQVYAFNTFDFNMWFKLAFDYDVYLIDKILFEYTIHKGQMSQRHWRTPQSPSGPIGMAIEIIDAISRMLTLPYGDIQENRNFLSGKLLNLNKKLSDLITTQIPDF